MTRTSFYLRSFIVAMFLGIAIKPAFSQGLQNIFSRIIDGSEARNAFWSVTVTDSSGRLLSGINQNKLVNPASNLKLLTSAAILDQLGGDYTFETVVYGVGSRSGSTWRGDIIVRGSGDPSISGRFYMNNRLHVFEKFYQMFDSLGIGRIDGNLIGNYSFFDREPYPEGWSWEDLSFYYGVETGALSFNENAVDLEVFAEGDIGERPRIQWFPFDTDYVEFLNEQTIAPPNTRYDEFYRRILGTNTIVLGSSLPRGYYESESLSIMNAALFFVDTFRKYLEDGGIPVNGQVAIDGQLREWDAERYRVLASHESVPLRRMLGVINTESSNFYTEMLLKTAAANRFNTQGSTDLGIQLVYDFAHSMGIDTTGLVMNDGSGLSPSTLISTYDLAQLLAGMQEHPEFRDYHGSLAIAGRSGSLDRRFRETPLSGRLWGKTGYVSGTRALSGYMNASSGRRIIFSIATNNYSNRTSYIDALHEQLLTQIYEVY